MTNHEQLNNEDIVYGGKGTDYEDSTTSNSKEKPNLKLGESYSLKELMKELGPDHPTSGEGEGKDFDSIVFM